MHRQRCQHQKHFSQLHLRLNADTAPPPAPYQPMLKLRKFTDPSVPMFFHA